MSIKNLPCEKSNKKFILNSQLNKCFSYDIMISKLRFGGAHDRT